MISKSYLVCFICLPLIGMQADDAAKALDSDRISIQPRANNLGSQESRIPTLLALLKDAVERQEAILRCQLQQNGFIAAQNAVLREQNSRLGVVEEALYNLNIAAQGQTSASERLMAGEDSQDLGQTAVSI